MDIDGVRLGVYKALQGYVNREIIPSVCPESRVGGELERGELSID